jgi:transcriptional regulator with XRE-family HTH domain
MRMRKFNPEKLYQARVLKRLSQEEVAKRAGITQARVSEYERGVKTPGADVLGALADALGLKSIDELYEDMADER